MPSNKRVFIALASKDGKIEGSTVKSLIAGIAALGRAGYEVDYAQHLGSCFISEARNALVDTFMRSPCMDMIFVDADVGFEQDALVKLMQHDVQVVGGAYPFKSEDVRYPVTVQTNGRLQAAFNTETKLIVARMVPTGLLRINRTVFNRLQTAEKIFKGRMADACSEWKYFQMGYLFDEGTVFWGEDTFFCRVCRDNGINIWLEPNLNLTHTGPKEWAGNYHAYLMSQETPAQKLEKDMENLNSVPNGYVKDCGTFGKFEGSLYYGDGKAGPAEVPLLLTGTPKVDISLIEQRPGVLI